MVDLPKEMEEAVAILQELGFNLEHRAEETQWIAEEKAAAAVKADIGLIERSLAFGVQRFLACACGEPGMDEDDLDDLQMDKWSGTALMDIDCPHCFFYHAALQLFDYEEDSARVTEAELDEAWKKWAAANEEEGK